MIPITNATSPTRVTRNACTAARRAAGRSLWWPTSRYEQMPMTSQPTSTRNRSSACTHEQHRRGEQRDGGRVGGVAGGRRVRVVGRAPQVPRRVHLHPEGDERDGHRHQATEAVDAQVERGGARRGTGVDATEERHGGDVGVAVPGLAREPDSGEQRHQRPADTAPDGEPAVDPAERQPDQRGERRGEDEHQHGVGGAHRAPPAGSTARAVSPSDRAERRSALPRVRKSSRTIASARPISAAATVTANRAPT